METLKIPRNTWQKAGLVVLFWVLFFLIDIVKKTRLDFHSDFFFYFYLPGFLFWILLTYPIFKFINWTARFSSWQRFGLFIVGGLLFSFIKNILTNSFYYFILSSQQKLTGKFDIFKMLSGGNQFYYAEAAIITWVVFIIFYVLELYQKYRDKALEAAQLESQLAQAELQALKMQIHPHFLFNAHHTIAMLVRANQNQLALDILLGLSDLMRISIFSSSKQYSRFAEEIDFIKKYLHIEQLRFEDRLQVTYNIASNVMNVYVPNLILQPLVENAIKHGISKTIGDASVEISACQMNQQLHIEIYNSGPPIISESCDNGTGVGIANTKARLKYLMEDSAVFNIINKKDGVKATLVLPYLEKIPEI